MFVVFALFSAQNGKFGVGMDMGCTVVFLFGAVLLLFGLHHGVQLDRIGAWGRGGGREGSNASGRSAFICFCSGHTQPSYLFYPLSLSLASHFGSRQPTTIGQEESFPAANLKSDRSPIEPTNSHGT